MWNGTMFVDLDWPLNASSPLSASAELLVNYMKFRRSIQYLCRFQLRPGSIYPTLKFLTDSEMLFLNTTNASLTCGSQTIAVPNVRSHGQLRVHGQITDDLETCTNVLCVSKSTTCDSPQKRYCHQKFGQFGGPTNILQLGELSGDTLSSA